MKVKIIAAKKTDWYHAQIGSIVNVDECTGDYKLSGTNGAPWISIRDCEVIEESTPQPEPFNMERALNGDKVINKEGAVVSEIIHIKTDQTKYPIVACIDGVAKFYSMTGLCVDYRDYPPLFMAPKEPEYHEGWVVVYPEGISHKVRQTLEAAENSNLSNRGVIHKIRFPKP